MVGDDNGWRLFKGAIYGVFLAAVILLALYAYGH